MAHIYVFVNASAGGDGKVKITATDSSSGFLNEELLAGSSKITKTVLNPGTDEKLELDVDQTQIDHDLLLNFVDAEHKPLDDASTTASSLWSSDKIQTELDLKQDLSEKGVANGYASLDGSGKLPVTQLPTSAMEFKGAWDASTNTPTLVDGTGDTGDLYRASVAGSQDLGSGSNSYNIGDAIMYNGTIWQKIPATDVVTSIFTRTGDVTAQAGDYDANQIDYVNTTSGLTATDAQAAIDEVEGRLDTAETAISDHLADTVDAHDASAVSYVNTTSGLTATDAQGAIDEVEGRLDTAETGVSNNATAISDHLADAVDAHDASAISSVASGNLASTDVQSALNELQSDIDTRALDSELTDHISDTVDAHDASAISYVNTTSGLTATDAQAAIDEVEGRVDTIEGATYVNSFNTRTGAVSPAASDYDADQIDYDNTTSGLTATEVQSAIDEIEARVDTAEGSASQIKVSANDTTDKYLEDAITVSSGANVTNILEVSTLNDGADEDFQIQIDEAKIDHDALNNFVANEHVDHSSVSITTNSDSGLSGGGDITASRTLVVDITGTTAETSADGADSILIYDNTASALRSMTRSNFLSGLSTTSAGDLPEASFPLTNNQTSPASITGFSFANGTVRSFQALVSVAVDATADLYEEVELVGIQKGSSWEISQSSVGDNSLVDFNITSAGQLTYTTPTYAGFVGGTLKFRSITTSV